MSVFKKYKGKRITPKDKNWSAGTWYVWKRYQGKIIHKALKGAQTKADAEKAESEIIRRAFNRQYGLPQNTDFADFANGTYTRYFESVNTNLSAKRLYVRTLIKGFKGQTLDAITPQDCRDLQTKLRKTLSASSVNLIMSTASKIFNMAGEEGLLKDNPMRFVKRLKEPPPRDRLLSAEEKERLWIELEKDELLFRLTVLAVNLPLRRGQLLAITPDAIDPRSGLLSIVASKGRRPRFVPANATAIHTLQMMTQDGQLPFPLKETGIRKRWMRALKRAKIENFRFHDLRREFASSLIRQNVNPETIRQLFAHSSLSVTQVYMASTTDELKAAVNSLDEVIDGGVQ